jgi:hypothetical protein
VRHTVGPVLERKFAELEKRLREAQRGYRKYARLVEARRKSTGRDESAAVYWNSTEMRNLVDDCLNVRVLDPAMGSGHFLVEVVDYVTNRLIDFLNGWSENPIWAFLEQTRDDILNDMERQRVTIDADRLTRVSLLKRAVLKRCVYGVDLNVMAVELAKVSLWLDAFTLGAPLSFLDHHLKHGNSLIGARVADVQKALEGDLTLFSRNKFAGVMLATNLMRQVSYLSDNTVEQSRQSAQAYRDARDHLAPYKRVLDVYTSRWFGNAPIKNRKGATLDLTVEFLRRNDTQAWLEVPHNPKNCLPDDDYMQAGLVAKTTLNAAEEKRFFHWELEFPEVFFAPSRPGGQDIQLRQDGGFDAVIGNPPYGAEIDDQEKMYYLNTVSFRLYQYNTYILFLGGVTHLLNDNGLLGLIVPDTWLILGYCDGLRERLITENRIREIIYTGAIFDQVVVDTTIVILSSERQNNEQTLIRTVLKEGSGQDRLIRIAHGNWQVDEFVPTEKWSKNPGNIIPLPETFEFEFRCNTIRLLSRNNCFFGVKLYQRGKGKPLQTQEMLDKRIYDTDVRLSEEWLPLLTASDIHRYELQSPRSYVLYGENLAEPRSLGIFCGDRLLLQRIIQKDPPRLVGTLINENYTSIPTRRSAFLGLKVW